MDNVLEKLAQMTGSALKKSSLTLTTAESCTGGGLSYWITSIPGSSEWFERGFVTYSNTAKIELLGVTKHSLDTEGAVSEQVVRQMATGALHHSHAELSIAITGIAGPDGGSVEKPVGTVWIAWAKRDGKIETLLDLYPGNRQEIRDNVIKKALEHLMDFIAQ